MSTDNEPDDYLIELMGIKEDFPQEALEAYGEIYDRYWEVMFAIAWGVTGDESVAKDLVSDTFNVVYNRASTFKKGKIRNAKNMKLSIKKWMTTILKNVFYDNFLDDAYKHSSKSDTLEESYIIEKFHFAKSLQSDYDDFIESSKKEDAELEPTITIPADNQDSDNLIKVKNYLNNLSERERDIILTTYNFYTPNKYTPSEVLDELESRWGTTRENIRKILSKFRKSIKEELQSQMILRK